ncbi:MAG: prolipoprotein diacylglyceryl transferase family protein [Chloroflexota bacterium]
MPIASIIFDFDPLLRLSDGITIRWQTVALVAVIAAGLIVAGLAARREGLRPDDLLFIAVATVPGAVVGGRLGYVLLHLDYYGTNSSAVLDPGQGSLELSLAVIGGVISGSYVAALLGAPLGRWMRAAALPLLFVLGTGKLAMVLGGAGQGQPADLPWATAYAGAGSWGSLAAALPSHPAQAYEGLGTLALLVALILALAAGVFESRDGRLFLVGLGGWALVRAVASVTWRDPAIVAGLNAVGLIDMAIALGCGLGYVTLARRRSGPDAAKRGGASRDVTWADPEARPPF